MSYSQRQTLFADFHLQRSLLRRLCVFWVFYHVAMWHVMFLISAVREQSTVSLLVSYREFAQNQSVLLMLSLAVAPIVFWSVLCFSHQIAGPLVQLRNRLRDMASGTQPDRVLFREGDMMSEIETAFNAYVAFMKAQDEAPIDGNGKSTEQSDRAKCLLEEAEDLKRVIENKTRMPISDSAAHDASDIEICPSQGG